MKITKLGAALLLLALIAVAARFASNGASAQTRPATQPTSQVGIAP